MKARVWKDHFKRQHNIEDAMETLDADASDAEIAKLIADYLISRPPPYRLGIMHDVRPSAERRIARIKERSPNYEPPDPVGPCPLDYCWEYKNTVGISTLDEYIAKQWIIDALMLGYAPWRCWRGIRGGGHGKGTLASFRRWRLEQSGKSKTLSSDQKRETSD